MAILAWLKKFQTPNKRETNFIGYRSVLDPKWTPKRYDSLSEEGYCHNVTVYRCVNLISKGLSSVPWLLYENDHEIEEHALLTLLKRPNPMESGAFFIESVMSYLLLSGNSYIQLIRNGKGEVVELYTLRPDRVRVLPGQGGIPAGYVYEVNGKKRFFDVDPLTGESDIMHLKLFHPLCDWYGLSPLEAASSAIDQHNAVGGHNLALLQNGGRPSGALMVKTPHGVGLSDTQRELLRQDIKDIYEGQANAGRVMVLEGDFDWKEMGLTPKDLDFVEGKNLSAREIAQAFGVPPMLVGVLGDATFANYKEARYHLWEDTILPLLQLLMQELNVWLTPKFGANLRIGFDVDEIPALHSRRETTWMKIEAASFLTMNEKRQAVGYSPLEGGDCLVTKEKK